MHMRVIAGDARGMRLTTPKGHDIRPTPDRVREALFNILAPDLPGASFLDLYAGTGANGIEALSRGAGKTVLVDGSPESFQCVRANLMSTKLNLRATLLKLPLPEGLDRIPGTFDIVFADPPYAGTDYGALLAGIDAHGLVAAEGILVLEHRDRATVPQEAGSLRAYRERRYGSTALTLYGHAGVGEGAESEG